MSGGAAVGIDFGTDCCTIAICGDSPTSAKPRNNAESCPRPIPSVIVNELGQRATPSWVQCPATKAKNGQYVVGATAQDQALRCGKRTVCAIKMALGHAMEDPQVQRAQSSKYWSCKVVGASEDDDPASSEGDKGASPKCDSVKFEVWEPRADDPEATRRHISADFIAAKLFEKLKNDATSGSGVAVSGAVVAVSASASLSEINAVKKAAESAGFKEVITIGSDIAIALAHGFDKIPKSITSRSTKDEQKGTDGEGLQISTAQSPNKPTRRILILDVGACSSTASILMCTNGILQYLTSPVTSWGVGGWFIDDALVQLCAKQFQRSTRLDIGESRRSLAKLRRACEKAKQSLSSAKESQISIEALFEGVDFQFRLNRSRFEAECTAAIKNVLSPIDKVLRNAGLVASDIDDAVIAGGSARIPKLQRAFEYKMGREIVDGSNNDGTAVQVDPSEAVAKGAAIHAAQLQSISGSLKEQTVYDKGFNPSSVPALSNALSVEAAGGAAVPIIEASTLLPVQRVFHAAASLDGSFSLSLLEGSHPLAIKNHRVLELSQPAISDINNESGDVAPKVQVKVDVDTDYNISVAVTFLSVKPAVWNDEGTDILVPESTKAVGPVLRGECKLSRKIKQKALDSDNIMNSKMVLLRDSLSRLDGTLEKALSPEETDDLEEDDVEAIKKAASNARGVIVDVSRSSIAEWKTAAQLDSKLAALDAAKKQFDSILGGIISQYDEAESEEDDELNVVDNNDSNVDSDMD